MIIGITGGIGSGKSFVSEKFCSFPNTIYYHADEEAKKIMNSSEVIRKDIIEAFGKESYVGSYLNREYISSIVFKNPEELKRLNSIVHPQVKKHFQDFVKQQQKGTIIIYENAILFEIGSDQFCDFVITVTAPLEERIRRVVKRDQTSKGEVLNRMKNQWSDEKKIMLSNYLVRNIKKEETLLKIKKIHNILTKKQLLF